MALTIGDAVPDFVAASTKGEIRFHKFLDDGPGWTMLFSHPRDFTPVCTTELGEFARHKSAFDALGVQLVALSCDTASDHAEWCKDIEAFKGAPVDFAIIDDSDRTLATRFRMLDPDEKDESKLPVPVRSVFFIGPDKRVRATICYPPLVGRNVPELLRVIRALQLGDAHPVATPVNWQPGDRVMIQPSLSDEEAAARFPGFTKHEVPSGKGYIRMTDDPSVPTTAPADAPELAASAAAAGASAGAGST
ncbi:hypothetical protein FNF27_01411 [Cafeteria roenbergensis]|uniref:Thioredoxin domain-containing protein n=1 Tax=Cafeteria roenbergensis TaxID=33653 RepID=A0A5A8EMT6_CAFRO|nr:hypothetical protein FNF29_08277 [Cafeteria roenbergensis]KAA0177081.1 hypothetical protein FNF27_01411 [Cafeteria roenbergensis]|eukprot:KAA0146041.1 hypothetical protein FNF29_08277 [Cafeteria roenbergensis]